MKELIKKRALDLGFCAFGVAPANLEQEYIERLTNTPKPPFVPWEAQLRCSPNQWLEDAKSVVVVAWAYNSRYPGKFSPPGPGQGYFSPFAQAPDYHDVVSKALKALEAYVLELAPESRCLVQVDTGPGCERLFALRAGVGWQGKNNFIIVPGVGSQVWLGLLTTTLELEPDKPMDNLCGDCELCIKACPTKAYATANEFSPQDCMSYWASTKEELTPEQVRTLARYKIIYGCDFCQLVCPHTKGGEAEVSWPNLAELLSINNQDFKEKYGNSSAAWRGKSLLKRNAVIASSSDESLKEKIQELAKLPGLAGQQAKRLLEGDE